MFGWLRRWKCKCHQWTCEQQLAYEEYMEALAELDKKRQAFQEFYAVTDEEMLKILELERLLLLVEYHKGSSTVAIKSREI